MVIIPVLPKLTKYAETNLPTPDEIRTRWCAGIELTDEFGDGLEDEDLQNMIDAKATEVERRLGIPLKPTVIVAEAEARGLVEGEDYDREEPPYDYDARAWVQYGFQQLRERPVLKLLEYKLVLPNGQIIMDFLERPEWLKLYKRNGQVHIVPYAGDPSIFNMAGGTLTGYPFITGAIQGNVPQMLYISYVAGYGLGKIPTDIRNIVAKMVAVDALGITGNARQRGITNASTSIDGLSESYGTTASATATLFQAQMKNFQDAVDAFFDPKGADARGTERGITMV
jgi:hypothetical protein